MFSADTSVQAIWVAAMVTSRISNPRAVRVPHRIVPEAVRLDQPASPVHRWRA
jgi:hypothetical protein